MRESGPTSNGAERPRALSLTILYLEVVNALEFPGSRCCLSANSGSPLSRCGQRLGLAGNQGTMKVQINPTSETWRNRHGSNANLTSHSLSLPSEKRLDIPRQ